MQEKPYTAVALGSFDGLHRGHAAVLQRAVALQKEGLRPCALLFSEHPQSVLTQQMPPMLLTRAERESLLIQMGIEPIHIRFSEIRQLSAADFVSKVLKQQLRAKAVCCGYNFHFGYQGAGDVAALQKYCAQQDITVKVCPAVTYEDTPISSTRIRNCITVGEIAAANDMLGRAFSYRFTVVSGDKRGRLLGFPTINQMFPPDFIVPKAGVYASKTWVDGSWYASVTDIGHRPTFAGAEMRSETCILDFNGDLYGQNIPVALLAYLRGEQTFGSADALKAQIAADAQRARATLKMGNRRK